MAETNKNLRKVLINRHSPNAVAPKAIDMYLGEIAVSHPAENLSATTIYTKNGDVMVPFASCAMTMTMINNAIDAADVTYDVKAKEGDAHVEVVSDGTEKAKVFTVSSKNVQSKTAFDAYSAETKTRIDGIVDAVDKLIDNVVTEITGDGVVIATMAPNGTGSNTYNLTHKTAPEAITAGFNKLATDNYGHVTAATAVEAIDIKKLGFEDSAWTEGKIAEEINKLDVTDTAAAGEYVSSVSETDGRIAVERANVSEAVLNKYTKGTDATAVAASDSINVAISKLENQIDAAKADAAKANTKVAKDAAASHLTLTSTTASDGSVTYTIGEDDIASKSALDTLSDTVKTFSAETVSEFNSAFTTINNLSADTVEYVKSVSGNIESVINAMDKDAEVVAGQVVTTVSQVDGKVTETKASVKDLQLGGYSKDPNATGSIDATDTINAALSKLENVIGANKITSSDKSIVVTEPTGIGATTGVKVNINPGERVIKLGNEGLYTDLNLVKITEPLPATVKERYEFLDSAGNKIGESIDIAKDSHIVSITYDESAQTLIYTYMDVEGAQKTVNVNMGNLILETEVENGVQSNNGKLSIKLDETGDDTGKDKFLTVGPNGLKLDGVSDAITAAVNALDVTDAAVAGQYVSSVSETDGKIAVTRANVSDAVLNGYAKGGKPASTEITATDDVKGAIAKLEHQIDNAKAAATTKVVEGSDAGNNMTIVPTTGDDASVTYTINLTDVASKAALDAEIAARKAVDGQDGQKYVANTGTNYISAATSLNDADIKLDAALKAEENARTSQDDKIEASIGLAADGSHVTTTGNYTSTATTVVGEIAALDSALKAVSVKVDTAIAGLDSSSATTDSGHYITAITITDGKITAVGESDKVNSASTAVRADAAAKVDQKLTFSDDATDVEYDGSKAETITFGSPVNASDITGRSLTITKGVVDVEIIDCGTY